MIDKIGELSAIWQLAIYGLICFAGYMIIKGALVLLHDALDLAGVAVLTGLERGFIGIFRLPVRVVRFIWVKRKGWKEEGKSRARFESACRFLGLPEDGNFKEDVFKKRWKVLHKAVSPESVENQETGKKYRKRLFEVRRIIDERKGWKKARIEKLKIRNEKFVSACKALGLPEDGNFNEKKFNERWEILRSAFEKDRELAERTIEAAGIISKKKRWGNYSLFKEREEEDVSDYLSACRFLGLPVDKDFTQVQLEKTYREFVKALNRRKEGEPISVDMTRYILEARITREKTTRRKYFDKALYAKATIENLNGWR